MALPWSLHRSAWDLVGVDSLSTALVWVPNPHHIAFASLKNTNQVSSNLLQVQGFLKASTNCSWYLTDLCKLFLQAQGRAGRALFCFSLLMGLKSTSNDYKVYENSQRDKCTKWIYFYWELKTKIYYKFIINFMLLLEILFHGLHISASHKPNSYSDVSVS